jgi:hypothetical protein
MLRRGRRKKSRKSPEDGPEGPDELATGLDIDGVVEAEVSADAELSDPDSNDDAADLIIERDTDVELYLD